MLRVGFALLLCCFAGDGALAKPARIASINLCADELVLRLADPANVVSVTWLSHDPEASNVADLAAGIGVNHGLAEEIVTQRPDLVVAGRYTTRATVGLLREVGIPVLELDIPVGVTEAYGQIREVAAALGEVERGEAVIAEMQARFADLQPSSDRPWPSAIVFTPNGFTVGRGSLVDELLRAAGLRNLAVELDLDLYGQVPLEVLVLAQPDYIILNGDPTAAPALAYEVLRHPVLRRAGLRSRAVELPPRLWTCAGPAVVEAVERLIEATTP